MKRKLPVLLAGALLLLVAVPAAASHTYVGTATAVGLELTLAGEGLTIGFSEAAVQSSASEEGCGTERGDACARGAGELALGDTAEAHAPGNEGPEDTAAFPIPEEFSPLVTGEIGSARAVAAIDGGDSSARGDGGAVTLSLTATQSLAEEVPLGDVLGEVSDNLLAPIAEGDPSPLGARLKGTVDLIGENLAQSPLLTLSGAPSTSVAEDVDGRTTATATAKGLVLVLVPTPANLLPAAPEGLVIVEVGDASATATTDQTSAEAEFSPAIVTVSVFDPTTGEYDVIPVGPGDSGCVPGTEGTPLETCITVGSGEETVAGAGAAAAAAGVSITALADPLPTLQLSLAEATAAVAAAPPPPPAPAPEPPPVVPAPDLPRTGAGFALPALAFLAVGGAGWHGVRRRR